MSWRRVLLVAVLLLVAASALGAMSSRPARFGETTRNAGATATSPPAPVVEITLPGDRDARAHVGDVVRLTVRAPSADVVEVAGLAVEQPVDPGVPSAMVFVADQPGRFRVRLRDADEAVGTLHVVG
jgi:hypothetical protein